MYDVVALGELLIDFTPKGISEAGNPILHAIPGGAPGNFLAALAKCGCKTGFIGKVGKDSLGKLVKETVEKTGVDVSGVIEDEAVFTTLAFVSLDENGDRSFSFARKPGADIMLTADELNLDMLKNTKVFHIGTLSLTDEPVKSATKEAVRLAKEAGALISVDPNYRAPLWKNAEDAKEAMRWALEQADIVKISDEEIEMLYNLPQEEAVKALMKDCGISLVFLTCGKKGCYFCNKNAYGFSPSFLELPTIDTNGAGDIFGGSAMSKIMEIGKHPAELLEEDLVYICRFANAMAGLSTTKNGAIPSIPMPQEALDLIK